MISSVFERHRKDTLLLHFVVKNYPNFLTATFNFSDIFIPLLHQASSPPPHFSSLQQSSGYSQRINIFKLLNVYQ